MERAAGGGLWEAGLSQWLVLSARGLCGGLFVMVFALIGELVTPKQFAGVFSAAPAVALAGMSLTLLFQGGPQVTESALGMIAGSVAMVAYCASAVPLVTRLGAVGGTIAALGVWAVVAAAGRALIAVAG